MTAVSSLQPLRHLHGLDSKCFALPGELHEILGGADHGIEPIEMAEALAAEDHPNIVPVRFDLGAHFADFVFRQSKSIRRFCRKFQRGHSNVLPALVGAKCARGYATTTVPVFASELWSQSRELMESSIRAGVPVSERNSGRSGFATVDGVA